MNEQPNNPTHGVKLEDMVTRLVEVYGWEELGNRIKIRCFQVDPSVKSSLSFLRKTPWARAKVETLFARQAAWQASKQRRAKAALEAAEGDGPDSQDGAREPDNADYSSDAERVEMVDRVAE